MSSSVAVRPVKAADAPELGKLHVEAFPTFFLASLGPRFLAEMYRGFASHPSAVALLAEQDGRIVGSAVGTLEPEGFFAQLAKSRFLRLGLYAGGAVLRRPSSIPRVVRGLTYRGGPSSEAGGALLSSICVHPSAAGSGVGGVLLEAWWTEVQERGVFQAYLTTDALENDRVLAFYQRAGWREARRFVTREGRPMVELDIGSGPQRGEGG